MEAMMLLNFSKLSKWQGYLYCRYIRSEKWRSIIPKEVYFLASKRYSN